MAVIKPSIKEHAEFVRDDFYEDMGIFSDGLKELKTWLIDRISTAKVNTADKYRRAIRGLQDPPTEPTKNNSVKPKEITGSSSKSP